LQITGHDTGATLGAATVNTDIQGLIAKRHFHHDLPQLFLNTKRHAREPPPHQMLVKSDNGMVAYFPLPPRYNWPLNPLDLKKVSALSGTNHKTTTTALENSCPLTPHRVWRATPPGFHHRTGLDYACQTTLSKNIYTPFNFLFNPVVHLA
jgi:hypothetical protein